MAQVLPKRVMLLGVAAGIIGVSGCKKYEDGPGFSLRSKTARLTGEWELVKGPFFSSDTEVIFEFEKDGDFKMSITYNYGSYSYSYSVMGDWEFTSDKEDLRIDIDGDRTDFEILRLANDELVLEDEDREVYEFEKQ